MYCYWHFKSSCLVLNGRELINQSFNVYFADTDLHNVIRKGNILKDIHKRYVMYQLCKATHYLHSGNVIHRDQKVEQTTI